MSEINLWINDREVKAKPNQTILEAADGVGITIPRLCYHPALKASGSCRLCAVEIDGYRGLPAACSTPVEENMRVQTATPKVEEFRREMLRLILQDHPRECLGCPRNGTCELQQLVASVGIDFPYLWPTEERPPVKPGGAYFERDYGLCVRCGRCVRICHEMRGAKAIVFREIEGRQEVSTPFERDLEEVGCQFCGACVDACPVGALREKLEPYQGQTRREMLDICENLTNIVMDLYKKEMPRHWTSSLCSVCTAGCRMRFELSEDGEIIQVKPHPAGPANEGQACVQGRFLLKGYLQNPRRLKTPLIGEGDGFQEKSWEDALGRISDALQSYAPGEVAVLTDARASNEELYALQEFARTALGSSALGVLTPSGHMAASEVLRRHFGWAAATDSLAHMSEAGCILAVGLNAAASHPIAGTYLRRATLEGARLVMAGPCETAATRYADVNLRCYPGTEAVLVCGLLRTLLDEGHVDPGFAEEHGSELQALKEALQPYDLETVASTTGVSQEELVEAVCVMGPSRPLYLVYGLGVAESPKASEITEALVAMAYATGGVGKPGGGIAPLYGNGNLQGAWDMGMVAHLRPGQVPDEADPTPKDILQEISQGRIKALYLVMENLEGRSLDFLHPYLDQLDFVVVQDVAAPEFRADAVLPMAALLEKGGTLTSGERRVQRVDPILDPPGEARSALWVLTELAKRMGVPDFEYADMEAVFNEIRDRIPAYAGLDPKNKAVQWPCPEPGHPGTPLLSGDEKPRWAGWTPQAPEKPETLPSQELPFAVLAKESLRPFFLGPLLAEESLTLFKSNGEIEMNPADGFGMGFAPGEVVQIATEGGQWEGRLSMNSLLPVKTVAVPMDLIRASWDHWGGGIFCAKVQKPGSETAEETEGEGEAETGA